VEKIFKEFDKDGDSHLTFWDLWEMTESHRDAYDFFGWCANKIEWGFTYWLLADHGKISKDDIYAMFDGSVFYRVETKRREKCGK
jgi:peroxygenase